MSDEKKKLDVKKFIQAAKDDPDFAGFNLAKKKILFALKMQKGNVTAAANMLGLKRRTIYDHCERDAEFKEAFQEIKDMKLDFVENQLMKRISEGSDSLIMFVLASQGADRGWVSIKKVDHSTNGKDLPSAPPQLVFVSSDQLSKDQLDKIIEQQQSGISSDDTGT